MATKVTNCAADADHLEDALSYMLGASEFSLKDQEISAIRDRVNHLSSAANIPEEVAQWQVAAGLIGDMEGRDAFIESPRAGSHMNAAAIEAICQSLREGQIILPTSSIPKTEYLSSFPSGDRPRFFENVDRGSDTSQPLYKWDMMVLDDANHESEEPKDHTLATLLREAKEIELITEELPAEIIINGVRYVKVEPDEMKEAKGRRVRL